MATNRSISKASDGRLPKNIKPLRYDVTFELDLEALTYRGTVVIDLVVLEETDTIVLHSLGLDLLNVSLSADKWPATKPKSINIDNENETVSFVFHGLLPRKANVYLKIYFAGVLREQFSGLYRVKYTSRDGTVKYGAATQFQATDARRALPCFDEPALKATFNVTLTVDARMTALSNMDVKSSTALTTSEGKQKKKVVFNTTPPMSSYLLAIAVGELHYAENKDFRIPVRVYTTVDRRVENCQYAADMTARCFKLFEKKFQIEYPLPKIDCVGLADKTGAMENWGLILYQESALLYDPDFTSLKGKALAASVVAHEEGHQWFGDIVTMSWWEGLWLNESFATWSSQLALSALYTQWDIWTQFATTRLQEALAADSLRTSHPIEVKVETSADIGAIFDAISYAKGGSVLRMLSVYLGEDVFLKGVARYLKAHAFANAETNDLWKALGHVSGLDIPGLMSVWTLNVGHPIINITEDENTIYVEQHRYLRRGPAKAEEDRVIWPVMLGVQTDLGTNQKLLLNSRRGVIPLPSTDFFKFNTAHSGVYRVLYSESRLAKLAHAASGGKLSAADRAGLLYDSISLTQSGHQALAGTFDLVRSLYYDSNYFVWQALLTWFTSLRSTWMFPSDEKLQAAITRAQLDFTARQTHHLGLAPSKNDDVIDALFKPLLFTAAGISGNAPSIHIARNMFANFVAGDRAAIPKDLRAAVFSIVLHAHGTAKEYDMIFKEYEKDVSTVDERSAAISALGYTTSPALIARTIELALDVNRMPNTMLQSLLSGLSTHAAGVEALFDTLLNRYDDVARRVQGGLGSLSHLLPSFCRGLATDEQGDRLEAFFAGKETKGFERALAQTVEEIRIKAAWAKRDEHALREWLTEHGYY